MAVRFLKRLYRTVTDANHMHIKTAKAFTEMLLCGECRGSDVFNGECALVANVPQETMAALKVQFGFSATLCANDDETMLYFRIIGSIAKRGFDLMQILPRHFHCLLTENNDVVSNFNSVDLCKTDSMCWKLAQKMRRGAIRELSREQRHVFLVLFYYWLMLNRIDDFQELDFVNITAKLGGLSLSEFVETCA
jgi:hypothetical protein